MHCLQGSKPPSEGWTFSSGCGDHHIPVVTPPTTPKRRRWCGENPPTLNLRDRTKEFRFFSHPTPRGEFLPSLSQRSLNWPVYFDDLTTKFRFGCRGAGGVTGSATLKDPPVNLLLCGQTPHPSENHILELWFWMGLTEHSGTKKTTIGLYV